MHTAGHFLISTLVLSPPLLLLLQHTDATTTQEKKIGKKKIDIKDIQPINALIHRTKEKKEAYKYIRMHIIRCRAHHNKNPHSLIADNRKRLP